MNHEQALAVIGSGEFATARALGQAIRERDEARAALVDAHRGMAWLLMMAGGTVRIPPTVLRERFDGVEFVTWNDHVSGEMVLELGGDSPAVPR